MVWLYREAYELHSFAQFLSASRTNFQCLNWLFDILATLYAICTAFLLWKGFTDHDKLRQLLSDEVNYIERMVGYLNYFDLASPKNSAFASDILEKLKEYIDNIVHGEEIKVSVENVLVLRESMELVASAEAPEDENDKVALAEIMKSLSDLAMARSKRLSQMEIRMSPYLLMALGIMSLTVIYPFFTEAPCGLDFIREICILTLGTLLSFLLMTLLDISRLFNGFWKIKTDAFEQARDLIISERNMLELND